MVFDGFLLRGLDKAASVYDQHFRLARGGSQFVPIARQNAHHHFAIHQVFWAAEADEAHLRRNLSRGIVLQVRAFYRFRHGVMKPQF